MGDVVDMAGEPHEQGETFLAKENLDLAAHFTSLAAMAANGDIKSYVGAIMTRGGPINFRSGLRRDIRDTFTLMGILGQIQHNMAETIRTLDLSGDLDGCGTEPDGAA